MGKTKCPHGYDPTICYLCHKEALRKDNTKEAILKATKEWMESLLVEMDDIYIGFTSRQIDCHAPYLVHEIVKILEGKND